MCKNRGRVVCAERDPYNDCIRWGCLPGEIRLGNRCYIPISCPPPVAITLSASPLNFTHPGANVTIIWESFHATHCHLLVFSLPWWRTTFSQCVPLSGTKTIWLDRTHIIRIVCIGKTSGIFPEGILQNISVRFFSVNRTPAFVPTGPFTITPDIIEYNQSSQLEWEISYSHNDDCIIHSRPGPRHGYSVPIQGTKTVSPFRTTIYSLRCATLDGVYRKNRGIIVEHPPLEGAFTLTPNIIEPGKIAILAWNISNADKCWLHGPGFWGGEPGEMEDKYFLPAHGTRETPALNEPGLYTLFCLGQDNNFIAITRGYITRDIDTIPPIAEFDRVWHGRRWRTPGDHLWHREDFSILMRFDDDDGRGLACCQVRTGWRHPGMPYIYTDWDRISCIGLQRVRMDLGSGQECPTQGRWACKIEIRAIDKAGNVRAADPELFNIDWTRPKIEIIEPEPAPQ